MNGMSTSSLASRACSLKPAGLQTSHISRISLVDGDEGGDDGVAGGEMRNELYTCHVRHIRNTSICCPAVPHMTASRGTQKANGDMSNTAGCKLPVQHARMHPGLLDRPFICTHHLSCDNAVVHSSCKCDQPSEQAMRDTTIETIAARARHVVGLGCFSTMYLTIPMFISRAWLISYLCSTYLAWSTWTPVAVRA
jgi:hypothetical protein